MGHKRLAIVTALALFTVAGCGSLSSATATPIIANTTAKPTAPSPSSSVFLKSGQTWQSLANNTITPRETIEITSSTNDRVVANLYISESGSLIDGTIKGTGLHDGHSIRFTGSISEPGLFANSNLAVSMQIREVSANTIDVSQTVHGSLINTYTNQPFRLTPGS
ncbi:MAG: hypothetical protein C7B46_18375 [Sulfobacillus benefaciens]|uniref:Bacterial spore germination immunoglobulin-like domain-containing protein n=1 Tax=Sulfobacillus benefaciens TaxID=453960 RepID=A0A2T2X5F0_9FIRM|nr:MAG: hypothetical protein C7B46_18375 [Sulfobacillus benefaciens]